MVGIVICFRPLVTCRAEVMETFENAHEMTPAFLFIFCIPVVASLQSFACICVFLFLVSFFSLHFTSLVLWLTVFEYYIIQSRRLYACITPVSISVVAANFIFTILQQKLRYVEFFCFFLRFSCIVTRLQYIQC